MNYKEKHEYRYETVEKGETIPFLYFQKNHKFVKFIIIFAVVVGIIWLITKLPQKEQEIAPKRVAKRDSAISRVFKRNPKKENCEQYALIVTISDYYPVLYRGIIVATDSIWLNTSEVWKYGKTCNGELTRYPGQMYYYDGKFRLDVFNIYYSIELKGTELECLIEEKKKIYNYPLLPECLIRNRKLIRPAGNKIDN